MNYLRDSSKACEEAGVFFGRRNPSVNHGKRCCLVPKFSEKCIYINIYKVVDEFKATSAAKSTVVDEFTVRLYKATSFFVFLRFFVDFFSNSSPCLLFPFKHSSKIFADFLAVDTDS